MYNKTELLNIKLHEEFSQYRNYVTLERYVMSELLSPIEDYYEAKRRHYRWSESLLCSRILMCRMDAG